MNDKTYLDFLPEAGRQVKRLSDELIVLYEKQKSIQNDLNRIEEKIKDYEEECSNFIKDDWSDEEIQEAKKRFENYLTNGLFL